ncbi:50S ribosomal protein L9 [Frondihabitans sp. PAMC 28766]|uniref:50S ribosomal protein L9 n=1 Tax=Frondihabitans sp. PAMC 28766 TaxID=1795630 RepID=UPI00078DB876|nr:50S ribosomal protein L9 [Frondihabitans sp. PAMC 28766]AMM19473.1 50S ribosomal protein L9 [Frondihabitans sp. PAMC 28766]
MSKVILIHEVSGLGSAGDVVDVKNGYARNYLVPQGFGVPWTRGGEKQVEQIRSARTSRELKTIEEAKDMKARLEAVTITLPVKTGQGGRLFGSVKPADVAEAVSAQGVGTIDKRKVEIPTAIKLTGEHEATIRLREDVVATIALNVVSKK